LKVNTIYLKLRLTLSKRKWKSNWMHAKLDTNIIWNVYFLKISLFPYGERKLKSWVSEMMKVALYAQEKSTE
jgi:hypothetical protein